MTPTLADYPCCVMVPYKVTIYWPRWSQEKPYMTDSGRVYVEMTTSQVALLEPDGRKYKEIRDLVRQRATENLKKDLLRAIERHEGIGGLNDYVMPMTGRLPMFAMLESVKVVLRGKPVEWIQQKGGISLTANVQFCVTANMYPTPISFLVNS